MMPASPHLAILATTEQTIAWRAHTPYSPCIHIIVQLGHMLSMIFTYTYEASRVHEQNVYTGMYNA